MLLCRWRKRGISCVPTQFGISFSQKWMNQAGALVHIYKDGSVLLTHGGTEMGQGLHTKMAQVSIIISIYPLDSYENVGDLKLRVTMNRLLQPALGDTKILLFDWTFFLFVLNY